MNEATSFMSSNPNTRSAPSMQISSIQNSCITKSTAFVTAYTYASADDHLETIKEACTQLFVRGIPGHGTLVLQVEPSDSIFEIKNRILHRVGVESASFRLSYGSRVLEFEFSLDHYSIPGNATINCVNNFPDHEPRFVKFRIILPSIPTFIIPLYEDEALEVAVARLNTECFILGMPSAPFDRYETVGFNESSPRSTWPDQPVVHITINRRRRAKISKWSGAGEGTEASASRDSSSSWLSDRYHFDSSIVKNLIAAVDKVVGK